MAGQPGVTPSGWITHFRLARLIRTTPLAGTFKQSGRRRPIDTRTGVSAATSPGLLWAPSLYYMVQHCLEALPRTGFPYPPRIVLASPHGARFIGTYHNAILVSARSFNIAAGLDQAARRQRLGGRQCRSIPISRRHSGAGYETSHFRGLSGIRLLGGQSSTRRSQASQGAQALEDPLTAHPPQPQKDTRAAGGSLSTAVCSTRPLQHPGWPPPELLGPDRPTAASGTCGYTPRDPPF